MADELNSEVTETEDNSLVELTADLVGAYVSNNPVPSGELPTLISQVFDSLSGLRGSSRAGAAEPSVKLEPAVSVRKSISDDMITCLDCGKGFKSLKRHLQSNHGMTPEEYRDRWNLKSDYPMVAPNYADARSKLAKKMGLGRKPGAVAPSEEKTTQKASEEQAA